MWVGGLLKWYSEHKREMPWRADSTPYKVWVSEIMLQQTQVDTVIPYFNRFITLFPTIEDLADAALQEVLKAWEGLGYYSRARNLHKAARELIEKWGGQLPSSYDDLQTLPGLGRYTAAALASIAFHKPVPVVDGNVLRVFARFWGIAEDIRNPKIRDRIFEQLKPYIQSADPSSFNQAIMELGALVCKPKRPDCRHCPLQADCVALRTDRVATLPFKSKRPPTPHYEIAVGVIWKGDELLIGRRRTDQMLGGLWEFPGGKRKINETLAETAVREILEETALTVTIGAPYCVVKHAYTHFKITLTAFKCDYVSGKEKPRSTDELTWISLDEIDRYPFPTANKRVIEAIRVLSRHQL